MNFFNYLKVEVYLNCIKMNLIHTSQITPSMSIGKTSRLKL